MRKAFALAVLPLAFVACPRTDLPHGEAETAKTAEFYSEADYERVDEIDLHAHIHAQDGEFVGLAREDRFRFVNIATHAADPDEMRMRHETVFTQLEAHPDRVLAVVSFPMEGVGRRWLAGKDDSLPRRGVRTGCRGRQGLEELSILLYLTDRSEDGLGGLNHGSRYPRASRRPRTARPSLS